MGIGNKIDTFYLHLTMHILTSAMHRKIKSCTTQCPYSHYNLIPITASRYYFVYLPLLLITSTCMLVLC